MQCGVLDWVLGQRDGFSKNMVRLSPPAYMGIHTPWTSQSSTLAFKRASITGTSLSTQQVDEIPKESGGFIHGKHQH